MALRRIVFGVSGASGMPLARAALGILAEANEVETHLVWTPSAELTCSYELDRGFEELISLADLSYPCEAIDAPIASGSFGADAMAVIPCSMKTLAGIANGFSDNLLLRAADVMIKEKRPLVLATREMPLSPIHLANMAKLAALPNLWIAPPQLTYYTKPKDLAEMEYQVAARILHLLGVEAQHFKAWGAPL